MATISVIIPVYNEEKHLKQCLQSIVNQSYRDIEIIIVDDGSDDGSLAIAEQFKERDQRIILLHEDHAGVGNAKNRGLEVARGSYLTFVNANHYLDPNYLLVLEQTMTGNHCDIIESSYTKVDGDQQGPQLDYNYNQYNGVYTSQQWLEIGSQNLPINFNRSWGALYKRRLFKNIIFDRSHLNHDERVMWKVYLQAERIGFVAMNYYYARLKVDQPSLAQLTNHLQNLQEEICLLTLKKQPIEFLRAEVQRTLTSSVQLAQQTGQYAVLHTAKLTLSLMTASQEQAHDQ
ncbi:glycosyltransferase family A protein [uncultured Limosilactobacillus sp.]|uniref:glycosyltransferase family 2 protein n=1 Tax=uncultured Limosilactobacillus sp. TaxID=2837629 RepID=UPI0025F4005F|nr:glycosyltransferase family A protein [uncultured Limosilactobacillus sp.]